MRDLKSKEGNGPNANPTLLHLEDNLVLGALVQNDLELVVDVLKIVS